LIRSLSVIYEDNHLLVINKPPLLATQGAKPDQRSVYTLAAEYLKEKYKKPGNVFVGIVSRLDAATSGVLVLARTSKAAGRLSEQIRHRTTIKNYLALVQGAMSPANTNRKITHFLRKCESKQRMQVCPAHALGAQEASLSLRCLEVFSSCSLVSVHLDTGRKHQIRVQMAALGFPILGDVKYGASQAWPSGVALHCLSYTLQHPTRRTMLCFTAEPAHWRRPLGEQNYAKINHLISANLNQNQLESM